MSGSTLMCWRHSSRFWGNAATACAAGRQCFRYALHLQLSPSSSQQDLSSACSSQAHGVLHNSVCHSRWLHAFPCVFGGACFTLGSYLAWAAAVRSPWLPVRRCWESPASQTPALYLLVRN